MSPTASQDKKGSGEGEASHLRVVPPLLPVLGVGGSDADVPDAGIEPHVEHLMHCTACSLRRDPPSCSCASTRCLGRSA